MGDAMTVRALCMAGVFGTCQGFAASAIAQSPLPQPSFGCANATARIERMICTDPELAQWDRRMGEAYKQQYARLAGTDRRALIEDQRRWVALRNAQCHQPELAEAKSCILQFTKARFSSLHGNTAETPQPATPSMAPSAQAKDAQASVSAFGTLHDAVAADQRGDYATATRIYRSLASQGESLAQFLFGEMYDRGHGVPQDYAEARKWFRLSADQGNDNAQGMLGTIYLTGHGVPQDYAEALKWFRLSAIQGNPISQGALGTIYLTGHGVPQDYAEALKWTRLAADQGNADAQGILGAMYADGQGVSQDYVHAYMWYDLSAAQGTQSAIKSRDNIARFMSPEKIAEAQKLATEWRPTTANVAPAEISPQSPTPATESEASAESDVTPVYQLDRSQTNVVALSNLSRPSEMCQPARLNGRVVHRQFDDRVGTVLTGVTVEEADGQRAFVNVDVNWSSLNVLTTGWVAQGLQVLLEEGNRVTLGVEECGSGGFLYIDSVRLVGSNSASPQIMPESPTPETHEAEATSGTTFFVSKAGMALTNAHVVERCQQIRVSIDGHQGSGRVLGRDDKNDLALLATDLHPRQVANWRLSVRQGEDIVVYGFPLTGVLASGGNVVAGNVTALAGLGDDSRFLQVSAPVQPGNSGGPLIDRAGNVVGVVDAKLNALAIASATGDIPQNVNFAIKASVAGAFLDAQNVAQTEGAGTSVLSIPDLAERAKAFTAQVVCVQ